MKTVNESLQALIGEVILWAPKAVIGILVCVVFWLASVVVRNMFLRIGRSADLTRRYVFTIVGRTASLAILLFGGITALGTIGINVSAFVAGLGLTGFALGFGLKDILANLISGVLILLYRPFSVNEEISVAGMEGVVTEIDLRYTRLDNDGKAYLIPNSTLITNPIALLSREQRYETGLGPTPPPPPEKTVPDPVTIIG